MQWNECCRSAHGGGPGTAGAVNCTWKRRRSMKFTYPAIIRKQDNGTWKAWLPDLACCEAVGDTLDDAIEEVNAAVYDWISLELSEDEADLPPVSDMDDLDTIEGDVTRNICVNIRLFDGWDE